MKCDIYKRDDFSKEESPRCFYAFSCSHGRGQKGDPATSNVNQPNVKPKRANYKGREPNFYPLQPN